MKNTIILLKNKFFTGFRSLWADRAMRVQFIKITLLLTVLSLPFAFPSALAKKNAGDQATVGVEKIVVKEKKEAKKDKKKKKEKTVEKKNYLTNEEGRKLHHEKFEVPPAIQPAVDFWKLVYSKYDRRFELFHDTENMKIIYSVLDFTDLYNNMAISDEDRRSIRKAQVEAEKDRIRAVLSRLAVGPIDPKALTPEEKKIYDLFSDPSPETFAAAAEGRIRSQTGIQDKFLKGVQVSGAYMQEFEDIFTGYGIPMEITRLVFVESMFNTKARSKVGASGLWQFMPSTGKLYLNIDGNVDERNDPIRATHAAARLLLSNYEALGSWPLAINAYNSGRGTMQNAVRSLGTTDIAEIIVGYRGGVYGFASRNFFPSFLAALEVANQYPKYFGEVKRDKPLAYEEYSLRAPAFFGSLVTAAGLNYQEMADMNPHFSETILSDQKMIPPGYSLRIPKGSSAKISQAESVVASQGSGL